MDQPVFGFIALKADMAETGFGGNARLAVFL
jgi:hypothetical protein